MTARDGFDLLVLRSASSKVAGCAVTYQLHETCPATCPWYGAGCYAQDSRVGHHVARLAARLSGLSAQELINLEASEIIRAARDWKGLVRGVPLRLHVSGDVSMARDAWHLADADHEWRGAGGGTCHTYTHNWDQIPLGAWGKIAVLASIEKIADIARARAAGYRPALVCADATVTKAQLAALGIKSRVCRFEAEGVPCIACKACHKAAPGLPVILFSVHGSAVGVRRARATIARINEVTP
ncbi:MAG: hypothetical protein WC565_07335 [Parcubacteria group bacterium]